VSDGRERLLDKFQIIDALKRTDFDANHYWVVAGAALVLHGVKEYTRDIDLGCDTEMADMLQEMGRKTVVLEDGSRRIEYGGIELFENWLEGRVEWIDSIPVISLEGIVRMKTRLGRDKDWRDIQLIREFQAKKAQN